MQVCTSIQADNHANTPPLSFLQAGRRMPFLPPNQQCQSTEGVKVLSTVNIKRKSSTKPDCKNEKKQKHKVQT